ncbi:MAG: hypothetical protein ACHQ1D_13585 [Nitrososphaerales archaeon]
MTFLFYLVQILSVFGADLSSTTEDGDTPMHYAASADKAHVCRFLGQRGQQTMLLNLHNKLAIQAPVVQC